ncbi:3-demethylubiquinone-9 3-O-methyltransferase [archaeon]|nr:MAG: 3-demethylubiquinone-9 3-O-methyltransferase [archaeon]
MNPTRISFIRSQLAILHNRESHHELDQLKGLKILDVGCGGGLLSESLARLGAIVTSIDPSEMNIAVAREHAASDPATRTITYMHTSVGRVGMCIEREHKHKCLDVSIRDFSFVWFVFSMRHSLCDIHIYNFTHNILSSDFFFVHIFVVEEMAQSDQKFDAVCSLEVLEHVDNVPSFLSACTACLSPHGSLFLSTLNRTQKARFLTITMAESVLKMLPQGTHDWNKYITPSELRAYLDGVGCDVVSVQGMVLDIDVMRLVWDCSPSALVKRWKLSDKDMEVNYILHAVRKIQD